MSERDPSARAQLKIRLPELVREQLEAAANARGVSMNAEAVDRLSDSLHQPELVARIEDLHRGTEVTGFLMLVEEAMTGAGKIASAEQGKPYREWLRDPYAFDEAVKAFLYLAERLRPAGPIPAAGQVVVLPDGRESTITGKAGDSSAFMALLGVAAARKPDAKPDAWTKAVSDRLGDLADLLLTPLKPKKGKKP